ncbi:MAG: glutathione S-transferase [Arenimonas sp.]|nr:glutathione S-transferase [Arenimonas sp.]
MLQRPIFYSFVRCPYAIRARLALIFAKQSVILREVSLKHKPADMLAISPKGTVPVLQLADGRVLEQSRDIMHWAISQNNPYKLRNHQDIESLLDENDTSFKTNLDQYKYPQRFEQENTREYSLQARHRAENFLSQLESRLQMHPFLIGNQVSLADIGVMPFVRQFACVDQDWFNHAPYPRLQQWLASWLQSEPFQRCMQKCKTWQPGDSDVITSIIPLDDARYPFPGNAESLSQATHL